MVAALGNPLVDTVRFTVTERADAEDLCLRLRMRWFEWIERSDHRWVVGVELRSESDDSTDLLRTVEAWVTERDLLVLRYEVDGRHYLMRSALMQRYAREARRVHGPSL